MMKRTGGEGEVESPSKAQKLGVGLALESKSVNARDGDRDTSRAEPAPVSSGPAVVTSQLITDAAALVSITNSTVDPVTGKGQENHPNQDRIKTRIGKQLYQRRGLSLPSGRQQALQSIFVVCDGHGSEGGPAASFFSSRLLDDLEECFFQFEQRQFSQNKGQTSLSTFFKEASDMISKVFLRADNDYRIVLSKQGKVPGLHTGGASATAIVVFQRFIALANVGDSRAILMARSQDLKEHVREGVDGLEIICSTEDHNLHQKEESRRVVVNGGDLARGGTYIRVGNHMLNMTRSLGDYDFKQDPNSPIVSPIPHVEVVDVSNYISFHDSYPTDTGTAGTPGGVKYLHLVAASDGLWDFILPEEQLERMEKEKGEHALAPEENKVVCNIISRHLEKDGSLDPVPPTKELRDTVHSRENGHQHGVRRLYFDDFSVLVTSLAFII